jgi:hypothetical protein
LEFAFYSAKFKSGKTGDLPAVRMCLKKSKDRQEVWRMTAATEAGALKVLVWQ